MRGIFNKLGTTAVAAIAVSVGSCLLTVADDGGADASKKTAPAPMEKAPDRPALIAQEAEFSDDIIVMSETSIADFNLIAPTAEMSAAILKAVTPKLRFTRSPDGELVLKTGIDKAPCDVAFTVHGKRLRGSGEIWESFSSFARPAGKSTTLNASNYAFFSGLEGGMFYKFKFRFEPNMAIASSGEAEGMKGYYNGGVETD